MGLSTYSSSSFIGGQTTFPDCRPPRGVSSAFSGVCVASLRTKSSLLFVYPCDATWYCARVAPRFWRRECSESPLDLGHVCLVCW